jgi:hypothetical protein
MVKYRNVVVEDGGRLNNYAIEPEMYVDETARTGFTDYAELVNGRLAMIGFVLLVLLEVGTGKTLIQIIQSLS